MYVAAQQPHVLTHACRHDVSSLAATKSRLASLLVSASGMRRLSGADVASDVIVGGSGGGGDGVQLIARYSETRPDPGFEMPVASVAAEVLR